MNDVKKSYYQKRAQVLLKNLHNRHFEAYYCDNRQEALKKALSLIESGETVSWGGATSANRIGLLDAVRAGDYKVIDRDLCSTPEEKETLIDWLSRKEFDPIEKIKAVTTIYNRVNIQEKVLNKIDEYLQKSREVLQQINTSEDRKIYFYQMIEALGGRRK